MSLLGVLQPLGKPMGLLLALCALSRWIIAPTLGGGRLALLLRFPGNLVHEGAHALGVWLSGYSVAAFRLSLFESSGRGYVQPGVPWTRHASPLLLRTVAAPAPLPAGMAVLCLLGGAIGSPIRLEDPLTWGLAFLSVSMAAELVPSDVDFRIMALPVLTVVAGLLGLVSLTVAIAPTTAPTLSRWTFALALPIQTSAWTSLRVVGVGTLLVAIPILLLRRR